MYDLRGIINISSIENSITMLPQLIFEVTDVCNLNCKYCGYGDFYNNHDARENQSLPIEKAIRLLDYLKKFWSSNKNNSYSQKIYISFYGGEPLLGMEFINRIVDYIEQLHLPKIEFVFSMTTNAMLLHKHIDYLVEKKFRLLISLDGNKKNHSYRVTHSGINSFEKVYQNIQIVRQKYPDFFKTNINFNSVLHNRNSVDEIYHFFKSEFDKKTRIGELNNVGISKDKEKLFMETYRNKFESLHQSENYEAILEDFFVDSPNIRDLNTYIHQYSGNVFRNYVDLLFDPEQKVMIPTATCLPFSKKMFVTVNGKILPCERIGHQFALGHITESEVVLDFDDIAKKYNLWYSKVRQQCSRCQNHKGCVQCIFNLDDLENKPVCKGFMNDEKYRLYSSFQMNFLKKQPHLYKRLMEEVLIK